MAIRLLSSENINGNLVVTGAVQIPASADGNKFTITSSATSNHNIIEMGQLGSDGFLDVSAAGGSIVSHLSGYTGYASYFLSNVGIGTTNPGRQLELRGQGVIRLNAISSGDPGLDFNTSDVNDMQIRYRSTTDALAIYSYGTSSDVLTIKKSDGNVGIGTTSPVSTWLSGFDPSTGNGTFKLTSEGWIVTPYLTGLAGYFPGQGARPIVWADNSGTNLQCWDNSATDGVSLRSSNGTTRLFVREDGNVGIGTTSPNTKLEVRGGSGSGEIAHATFTATANRGLKISTTSLPFGQNSGTVIFNAQDTEGYSQQWFQIGGATKMVIDNSGNVGIGTSNPASLLHIKSTATTPQGITVEGGDESFIKLLTGGVKNWGFITTNLAASDFGIYQSNSNGGDPFTAGTPRLYFDGSGNVGIGTTSPTEKLSVSGNIELDDMPANGTRYLMTNETNTGTGRLNIQAGGGSAAYGGGLSLIANSHASKPGWVIAGISSGAGTAGGATEGRFVVNTHGLGTGSDLFTVLRTGNVGIGTTSPSSLLTLNKATGEVGILLEGNGTDVAKFKLASAGVNHAVQIGSVSNNEVQFHTANSEKMRLAANGNVGIGTTSPSAKLQVQQDQTAESNVMFMNNSTGANAAIRLSLNVGSPAGNDPKISFNIGDGGFDWTMGVDNSDSDKFKISGGTDSHNPNLGTNDRLVIDGSGNVGIGISPVSGARLTLGTGAVANEILSFASASGGNAELRNTSSTGTFTFTNADGSSEKMRITSGGNVGIGTTSPSARLNVEGVGQANNPTVAIDVTNSDSFNHGLEIFDGNLTTGETVLMAIGHSGSTKLTAIYGFIRNENSLDQNLATIGFWGADNKLTVSAGGNVGIGTGTTTPAEKLTIDGTVSGAYVRISNAGSGDVSSGYMIYNGSNLDFNVYTNPTFGNTTLLTREALAIRAGGSERMRITSAGNVGIGNTSPQTTLHTGPTTTVTNAFTARFAASNFFASGGNSMFYVPDTAANIMMFGSNQFGTNQIEFYHKNPGTSQAYVGRISTSGSATSYVTSSDYRLKENIVPISESISRLNQLKPSRFNFIEEPGKVVDGFIAHEVQDIVPEAIVGEKDEVDEEGGIIPQGIDQAKLVPLLVAAVQELEARVKELENK